MMMQRLSRESLRIKPPNSAGPVSPIVYETSKQVKKAYSKKKGTAISEAERRRIERLRELDARAEKIRLKEERKKQNALKRKLKEEKEGPKKLVKLTSSQPELLKFFVTKKEQVPVVKDDCDDSDDTEEPVADDVSRSEDDAEADSQVKIKSEILGEKSVPDANTPTNSPPAERQSKNPITNPLCEPTCMPNLDICTQSRRSNSECLVGSSSPAAVKHHAEPSLSMRSSQVLYKSGHLVNHENSKVPSSMRSNDPKDEEQEPNVIGIPQSSPPQVITFVNSSAVNKREDLLSEGLLSEWDDAVLADLEQAEKEAEAAITKREEDDRFLETHRHETDHNDLDDDYDLQDDINFEYGDESSIRERADERREDEKEFRSSQAYRIGLSDPAFDELQEEYDSYYEGAPQINDDGDECGENIPSSYLCQAFEDDLKELEES
ncbi:hypothetical protein TWF696_009559 [Orbilia brochopaga]|uniref:Uncharacterized protein n=1 Tax=Orbilia brochopaga TaxID=3140254 RepID=A0AAV9UD61_9PEZI